MMHIYHGMHMALLILQLSVVAAHLCIPIPTHSIPTPQPTQRSLAFGAAGENASRNRSNHHDLRIYSPQKRKERIFKRREQGDKQIV